MKKLFSFVMVALMGVITVYAQSPSWIGNSYIIANGSWYNGSGSGKSDFNGADLGTITQLTLGGQVQDYGNSNGQANPPSLNYRIDESEWQSISLAWYDYENNNNWYGLTDAANADVIDISGLEAGEHTIAIYFKACNDKYDSNDGNNFVATFVTEPIVTDITISGDKYVGTELTFAATVAGFSADPDIIYEVKAGKGDYEQAQGGKYTPAAAGDYTVKATAFYQPEEGNAEEASKEVAFTVTEAPVKEYYLVGWINGANSGCEGDAESFHEEYKFVDGTLTTTFTETSYVFVKTSGNNNWYLAESYVEPAAKVTATLAEGKTEKVAVNANVEVTFTLTENNDGTVTLSYEEAAAPVKYYAKNNWDGGDLSWKEMTQFKETVYTLDSVVFGGTGININTKEEDTDAFWFDVDHIYVVDDGHWTDTIIPSRPPHIRVAAEEEPQSLKLQAGDTIMLVFNAADTTLYAGIYGRPEPECEPGYAIMVNGERHMLTLNAEQKDYTEYWIDSLELKADDEIVLFDTCAQMTFKVAVKGYEGFEPVGESDTLKVTENAYYQLYLKLIYGADELYVVKLEEPDPSALENIMQNSGLKKFILNGQMYIQHNDRLYNAAGYLLK